MIHFIDRFQICWPIITAMAGADWVGSEIKKLVPGATVEVSDLHGTGDHFHVRVISDCLMACSHLKDKDPFLTSSCPTSNPESSTHWILSV